MTNLIKSNCKEYEKKISSANMMTASFVKTTCNETIFYRIAKIIKENNAG